MRFVLKHNVSCQCDREDLGADGEWEPAELPIIARNGKLYVEIESVLNLEERFGALSNGTAESVQDCALDMIMRLIELWDSPYSPVSLPIFLGHRWTVIGEV